MTRLQAEVIMAMAANGLSYQRAGYAMNKHHNTVRFHAEKIRESTGKDPQDFYDMIELEKEARQVLGTMEK